MQIMSLWQQHFNYTSSLQTVLVTSTAVNHISCMDVHMQDICTEMYVVCFSAQPPAVEPVSCCQVLHFGAMEGCERVGTRCGWVWVLSYCLSRPQKGRFSVRLVTSLHLLCPHVPSVSLAVPPVGHERTPFLFLFPILAFFLLLSGSEIHIHPQSSHPQKGCFISDNIKEQIRQSVTEQAKQGWSKVTHIWKIRKMTRRPGRMGVWGKRGSRWEKSVQHVSFHMAPEIFFTVMLKCLLAAFYLPCFRPHFSLNRRFPLARMRNTLCWIIIISWCPTDFRGISLVSGQTLSQWEI